MPRSGADTLCSTTGCTYRYKPKDDHRRRSSAQEKSQWSHGVDERREHEMFHTACDQRWIFTGGTDESNYRVAFSVAVDPSTNRFAEIGWPAETSSSNGPLWFAYFETKGFGQPIALWHGYPADPARDPSRRVRETPPYSVLKAWVKHVPRSALAKKQFNRLVSVSEKLKTARERCD